MSCQKALKFLGNKKIKFEAVDITSQPPTKAELKRMAKLKGDVKKLFSTNGVVYKEMGLADKLPKMSDEQALDLLSKNGRLVKRPFVLTGTGGVVGFKEAEWKTLF